MKFFQQCLLLSLCLLIAVFQHGTAQDVSIEIFNSCANTEEGSIKAEIITPDKPGPFSFIWTDSNEDFIAPSAENPYSFSRIENLAPGEYCLIVISDNDGCIVESCNLRVEGMPVIELETATCVCPSGYGHIDVNVSMPGVDPNNIDYDFTWSIGGGDHSEIENHKVEDPNVFQGDVTYTLELDEINSGCTATFDVYVPECDFDLNSYITVTPDCNKKETSTISMLIPNGMGLPDYHVTWIKLGSGIIQVDETSNNDIHVYNAESGEYCVTVLTSNGCEENICGIIVEEYEKPTITSIVTPVTNGSDGAISLSTAGGTGPIVYEWDNGETTSYRNGLGEGEYDVTVTYNGGECEEELSFDLFEDCQELVSEIQTFVKANAVVTPMSGAGNNASIELGLSEAYPGYGFDFQWGSATGGAFSTEENVYGLGPDLYNVIIFVDGCSGSYWAQAEFRICNNTVDLTSTPVDCEHADLTVTSLPTTPWPSTFEWETGETSQTIEDALIGTEYCVTVTYSLFNCESVVCITPEQEPLDIDANVTNATNGNNDGEINISVSGGVPPYQYLWDDGNTDEDRTGLSPGNYTVTVTDDCENSDYFNVTIQCEFGPNEIDGEVTSFNCGTGAEGKVELTQLPQGNLVFQWTGPNNFSATTQNIYNLTAGFYNVRITDTNTGCHAKRFFNVQQSGTSTLGVHYTVEPGCWPVNEGSITAYANGGGGGYGYSWAPFPTQHPPQFWSGQSIEGVPSGWYNLNVFDSWGCSINDKVFLTLGRPPFSVDLIADPTASCAGDPTTGEIVVTSGTPEYPLSYEWQKNSGPIYSTDEPLLSNMYAGFWGVTVTDGSGCETYAFENIELSPEIEISAYIIEACQGSSAGGNIILEVSGGIPPYTYFWEDGSTDKDRTGLIPDSYYVTVNDDVRCTSEEDFTVTGIPPVFEYEVEIVGWFGYGEPNGHARVEITSDEFDKYGRIRVYDDINRTPPEIKYHLITEEGTNKTLVKIPYNSSYVEKTLYFTYSPPGQNDCLYEGEIPEIKECIHDPADGFYFSKIEYKGNDPCDPNQNHEYEMTMHLVGQNFPYFVDIYILNPDGTETLAKTEEITEYNLGVDPPILISGVPAGNVKFVSYSFCRSIYQEMTPKNCCEEFSCELISGGKDFIYDGYRQIFPSLDLVTLEECFRDNCFFPWQACSELILFPRTGHSCWEGMVTVYYPGSEPGEEDGPTYVFEVLENGTTKHVSGDDSWRPPKEGVYDVFIDYSGNSGNPDCFQETTVSFYGPDNGNEAIGFNNDYWFTESSFGTPPIPPSYFGAWSCETCNSITDYLFQNNQGPCENIDNWQYTFFEYEPTSTDNPCYGGGTLTIMEFDANGQPSMQEFTVPLNSGMVIDEIEGIQPLGLSTDIWCTESGGCVFDPNFAQSGQEPIYDVEFDLPIFATWGTDCNLVVWPEPGTPNPNACETGLDCPDAGMACINEDCYVLCQDGECVNGECTQLMGEWVCLDDPNCEPNCPAGYICENNNCYLNEPVCNFNRVVTGGGSANHYSIYHGYDAEKELKFTFETFNIPDRLLVNGDVLIDCISTNDENNKEPISVTYITDGQPDIEISVYSCGSNSSKWALSVTCLNFNGDPPINMKGNNDIGTEEIFVHPNPFVSNIDITASNIIEPFKGQVIFLDNLGKEVVDREFSFEAGYNSYNIDGLDNLPNGVYFILVKNEGGIFTAKKVVKAE